MEFLLLADEPSAAETVASWYFEQWCRATGRYTKEQVLTKVSAAINRNNAPMLILAKLDKELVGAAELKIREMEAYPDYEFWLGGVYVTSQARGYGVASALVNEALSRARAAGIKQLYLQTEDLTGGLYVRHGFVPLARVGSKGIDVLVMVTTLAD
ncbi:MAG: GNAT family N-acetyltransferase [Gammaproteobacteria bacterium]|nr:GNAT family N-acetyltransferase [Gammaproteobacteria bacterium]